jgi:signal transduction histidine kinase
MRWLAPRNWTFRVRLTVLYGGMFFAAGALLLALTYGLVRQSLDNRIIPTGGAFIAEAQPAPATATGTVINPVPTDTLERIQQAVTAEQNKFRDETLNALLGYGGLALAVVGLIAVGFGWLMSERVLRPLHRITETARRIGRAGGGQAALHERISLAGPRDEITELADTFDAMLERLDKSFDGQRRFVANASHELRTPLAINRALLEVAVTRPSASADVRQLGDTLLAVNARHERLIDGLLTLARSEQEVIQRVPVDLADIVDSVADELTATAKTAGVTIRLEPNPCPVAGDPVLLAQLVTNLISNGIRHNVAQDGWVRVRTGLDARGRVELVVSNTGPTVSGYQTEAIFEPFRRLDGDRLALAADGAAAGVGLGLSIVRSIAHAHGGLAMAQPRDGGGLVIRVTFPGEEPDSR